ncbi:serine/threonine-protein kinase SRK2A-like [Rutidosis leptorrhynchoides]|uniref:serine/threonine-protein kinase SRK2A-like n=1 Tax=Rutidosis leptorrhynchoides TaxID=125765 RepID=UPI003A996312
MSNASDVETECADQDENQICTSLSEHSHVARELLRIRFRSYSLRPTLLFSWSMQQEESFSIGYAMLEDLVKIRQNTSYSSLFQEFTTQICHRDLKLENTIAEGSPAPRMQIRDFFYLKVFFIYVSFETEIDGWNLCIHCPEVLSHREYDCKSADVWSCGVTL